MSNVVRKEEFTGLIEIKKIGQALEKIYINEDLCYVRILDKSNNKFRTYPINKVKKLNENLDFNRVENVDIMMSLNPFKTVKEATKNNLFCINTIAIDLDYKKVKEFKELSKEQIIKLLELDYFNVKVPYPSIIETSNQIRLIYLIETCYIPKHNKSVINLADRVISEFTKALKDFGAEVQGLQSYFRAIGSINSKNNSIVRMYEYPDAIRYTLNELQELWLDDLPSWYKGWKAKRKGKKQVKNNIYKLHNLFIFNKNRLLDLELYQEYLNSNKINNYRERLCFLYRNYVLISLKYENKELTKKDFEYAKNEMLKYNAKFNIPMRENVIESLTRVVNYRQYYYKNETLMELLEITEELSEIIGFNSVYKTKTSKEWHKDYYLKNKQNILEKKKKERRNKNGLTKREQEKQDAIKAIKKLKSKGLKQIEIAKKLNKSIRTIKSYWNL